MRKLFLSTIASLAAFPAFSQCNELFFSEYLEGSSNNKALEIYNPTSSTVDLSHYKVYRANNGAPAYQDSLHMAGMLAPGAVYVIGNPSASGVDPVIVSTADTLHTVTFFNGDDVVMLKNIVTGTQLDIIGILGVDPGTNWPVGTGFTSEYTLVRMASVNQGTMNWAQGATEWDVYPQNTVTFLGSHTMTPCAVPTSPIITFSSAGSTVTEANTPLTLTVDISYVSQINPTSVDIALNLSSTATGGAVDYSNNTPASFPTTLTWAAGDSTSQTITLDLLDDALVEGSETIILDLINPTNSATINISSTTWTITDNDTPPVVIPTYPIGTIATVDSTGALDSTGVACRLVGIVYGVNLRPTGLQFTLRDQTGGIAVFKSGPVSAYTVVEGDSIDVYGTLTQFNGLAEILPDSIHYFSTGHSLKTPTLVSAPFTEAIESDLIRINHVQLVTPAQWTGTGSGFNVDITDGTNTWVMRIDNDVNLYSQPAPVGFFDVIGLGSQFDNAAPFDAGYQLMPRYIPDILLLPTPVVALGNDTALCNGDSLLLDAGNPGLAYAWSTGDTTQTIWVSAAGTYSVTVTDPSFGTSASDDIVITMGSAPVAAWNSSSILLTVNFIDASSNASSYEWDFGDGNTTTTQNPSHTYAADGAYFVCLTVTNACGSNTFCDSVNVIGIGRTQALANTLTLSPNPNEGNFTLSLEGIQGSLTLEIVNPLGQVIARQEALSNGSYHQQIQLDSPVKGLYLVRLTTSEGTQTARMLVQ